jgi:pilus assembly protein CpaE
MFVRLNCVIVDADTTNRQELSSFVAEHGVTVSTVLPTLDRLPGLLRQKDPPRLVIVNLDPHPHDALRALGPLVAQHPQTSFFAMSQHVDSQLLLDAIHLRITEFIPLPMSPERLLAGIERVAQADHGGKRGKIINVIPTMGGCGATTVACNVAASMARSARTVLLDLDLVCGSVACAFDITPRYTIADVMSSGGTFDKHLLDNALAVHQRSGLAILARPEQPEASQQVTREGFRRLLAMLAQVFDYVIIDSQMSLDPLYTAALQAADTNLLVMELNVPSARNAERFVGAMRRMGVETDAIKVVVNRFERGTELSPSDVEAALGLKIAWTIPNDFKNTIAAINYGEPVVLRAPRAEVSGSLAGLVKLLNGRADAHN